MFHFNGIIGPPLFHTTSGCVSWRLSHFNKLSRVSCKKCPSLHLGFFRKTKVWGTPGSIRDRIFHFHVYVERLMGHLQNDKILAKVWKRNEIAEGWTSNINISFSFFPAAGAYSPYGPVSCLCLFWSNPPVWLLYCESSAAKRKISELVLFVCSKSAIIQVRKVFKKIKK